MPRIGGIVGFSAQRVIHSLQFAIKSLRGAWEGDAMAVRDWRRRIIGSGSDAKPGVASSHPVARPATARPGKNAAIAYAVNLSGRVIDQPEAMSFYEAAFADHPSRFVTYDDLRKQGDLLDKDALKALGLRANVKLSAQFLATLNERGRDDPSESASVIGLAVATALGTVCDLSNMEAAGIDLAKFHASNSAAGPCGAASKLGGQNVPTADAPIHVCAKSTLNATTSKCLAITSRWM